jgi:hypothetical protein
MSQSLIQRIPTKCSVSECDGKTSAMKMPSPTNCPSMKKQTNNKQYNLGSNNISKVIFLQKVMKQHFFT